jgi:hypothetical protein
MTVAAARSAHAQSQSEYSSGLGLCIQPAGGLSSFDGDGIVQVGFDTCFNHYDPSMFWSVEFIRDANGAHWFHIRNVGATSGGVERCLDLTDGNTADGTPLQLWTCNLTSDTMLWTFAIDDNGKPRIINKRSGKCMDVRAGSTTPGAVIQNYHCASFTFGRPNLAQQWFGGPR